MVKILLCKLLITMLCCLLLAGCSKGVMFQVGFIPVSNMNNQNGLNQKEIRDER